MKRKRLSIAVNDEVWGRIYAASLFERRSTSAMAEILIELGLIEHKRQLEQRFYGDDDGAGAAAGAVVS